MRARVVESLAELVALDDRWSSLLARSASNHPFLSPQWLLTWWRVFGPHDRRRLRVVAVEEGDRLVGLAPLLARRHRYRNLVPFRRIEMLGSGEDEVDEICSDYLGVIAEPEHLDAVTAAVAGALASGELGGWDELVIRAADGDSRTCAALRRALHGAGFEVETRHDPRRDAPYIELPASWDDYLAGLSSSRRSFVRRSIRALESWGGDRMSVEVATTRETLGRGRDILVELHEQRWSESGHRGAFGSQLFRTFHDRVMPALADAGALELLWIEVGGQPIAALYNIVWDNKVYFYQSGRRVDVPPKLRPGIAVHALAIRRAIEAGRREYDFLAGMGRYAQRLSNHRREVVDLRATRPGSPVELGRRAMEGAVAHIKRARERLRERRSGLTSSEETERTDE